MIEDYSYTEINKKCVFCNCFLMRGTDGATDNPRQDVALECIACLYGVVGIGSPYESIENFLARRISEAVGNIRSVMVSLKVNHKAAIKHLAEASRRDFDAWIAPCLV